MIEDRIDGSTILIVMLVCLALLGLLLPVLRATGVLPKSEESGLRQRVERLEQACEAYGVMR